MEALLRGGEGVCGCGCVSVITTAGAAVTGALDGAVCCEGPGGDADVEGECRRGGDGVFEGVGEGVVGVC